MDFVGRAGSSLTVASSSGLHDGTGKLPGGSGTGSSEDSLAGEVGRLAEENARYRRKLADLKGKSTAGQPPKAASSTHHLGSAEREQLRRLKKENHRLFEQNAALERRLSCSRSSTSGDQLWRYKEEVRSLRAKNAELAREKEKFDRTAEYVCQKVLKIIGAARREGNFNSQLVGELKRWNEKLEDENHRLYRIIDKMQNKGNDVEDAVAEATVLSKAHNKDRVGNAAIVKELENQNVKIQEEMSKLSDQAMTLQNLSSSSSGSSGPLPPRTPSNHEMDGSARRSVSPVGSTLKGRRINQGMNRKNRNMSMESVGSDGKEFEALKQNNKKYSEDIERIGADLAYVREQVAAKTFSLKEQQDANKASEAARLASLEQANSMQAIEIERLMSTQSDMKGQSQLYEGLKEEFAELEDDCLKLATEVERLQPIAVRVTECEAQVEEYRQKLASFQESSMTSAEIGSMKTDQVEMQRTLSAMAADKAVLQAELRELLEERNQLQDDLGDLDAQVQQLQERANSATYLESELEVAKEENLAYCKEIENLRLEKESLKAEIRDLEERSAGGLALRGSAESVEDPRDQEIALLRAENEDLTSKSYNNVILNVELTTLRNQVKDLQGMETKYQEQIAKLKQDRSTLQKEADSIPAFRAEIADLKLKVQAAEAQLSKQVAEVTNKRDLSQQPDLVREHEERGRRVRELKEESSKMEAELGRSETRLRSLQAKYDSLLRDHTQRSQQAVREQEDAESQSSVLTLALKQERTKNAHLGHEAAELHSLLQTAHNERQVIQSEFAELRNENSKLVQRVTQLDTKNEELERMLDDVFNNQITSNGHSASHSVREDPIRGSGISHVSSGSSFDSSLHPKANGGKVKVKAGSSQEPGTKPEKNGFSSFFSRKKSKSSDQPLTEDKHQESLMPAPSVHEQSADLEVMNAYDRFVDTDDIDGFMTALGYKGFRSPTSPDDMKGAFASARYVVRPEALNNVSEYKRQKGEATHDLLEAWYAAWAESMTEQGHDIKSLRSL